MALKPFNYVYKVDGLKFCLQGRGPDSLGKESLNKTGLYFPSFLLVCSAGATVSHGGGTFAEFDKYTFSSLLDHFPAVVISGVILCLSISYFLHL